MAKQDTQHGFQVQAINRVPSKSNLQDQLASRSPYQLGLVALRVVGQPPAVGHTLHHLQSSASI